MQRYFVQALNNDLVTLSEDDSYHIIKVMRMHMDDQIEVVYQEQCYIAKITSLNSPVQAKIITKKPYSFNLPSITLVQSLIKEQKMDFIIQKATELGVKEIIPLKTNRTIVNIDKKAPDKINRWQKIAKEASEQSKRLNIPNIVNVSNIKDILALTYDYKLLFTVNEMTNSIKKVLSNITISDRILVVVGPEGGFTKDEEQILMDHGFISVTLGNLVLRSETVALNILSIINYLFMR